MTAFARMPEGADTTGATDASAAIQAAFDAMPAGSLFVCPDGIYRIDTPLVTKTIGRYLFSRGAILKATSAIGTAPILRVKWDAPDTPSVSRPHQTNVQMTNCMLSGGNFERASANGPCVQVEAFRGGKVQGLRCLKGNPHLHIASSGGTGDWLLGGSGSNWTGIITAIDVKGFQGGAEGLRVGHDSGWDPAGGNGESNRVLVLNCYLEGNGAAGSVGVIMGTGSGITVGMCTLKGYERMTNHRYRGGASTVFGLCPVSITSSGYGWDNPLQFTHAHIVDDNSPTGWVTSGNGDFYGWGPVGKYGPV